MARPNSLYSATVEVTSHYLGPAADRFINRQIRSHLNKDPEELVGADLMQLIDWIKVAMAFLTDDDKLIRDYLDKLKALSQTTDSKEAR